MAISLCFILGQTEADLIFLNEKDIPKTCTKQEERLAPDLRNCLTQKEKENIEKSISKKLPSTGPLDKKTRAALQIFNNKITRVRSIEEQKRIFTQQKTNRQRDIQRLSSDIQSAQTHIQAAKRSMTSCREKRCHENANSRIIQLNTQLSRLRNHKKTAKNNQDKLETALKKIDAQYPKAKWEFQTAREIYSGLKARNAQARSPAHAPAAAKQPDSAPSALKASAVPLAADSAVGHSLLHHAPDQKYGVIEDPADNAKNSPVLRPIHSTAGPQKIPSSPRSSDSPITPSPDPSRSPDSPSPTADPAFFDEPASSPEQKPGPFRSVWNWLTGKPNFTESSKEAAGSSAPTAPQPTEKKLGFWRNLWENKLKVKDSPAPAAETSAVREPASPSSDKKPGPFKSVWNWLTGKPNFTASSTKEAGRSAPAKQSLDTGRAAGSAEQSSGAGSAAKSDGLNPAGAVAAVGAAALAGGALTRSSKSAGADSPANPLEKLVLLKTKEKAPSVKEVCRLLSQKTSLLKKREEEFNRQTRKYEEKLSALKQKSQAEKQKFREQLNRLLQTQKQTLTDVASLDIITAGKKLATAAEVVSKYQVNARKIHDLRRRLGVTDHLTQDLVVTVRPDGQVNKEQLIKFIKTLITEAILAERAKSAKQKRSEDLLEQAQLDYDSAYKISSTLSGIAFLYTKEMWNSNCDMPVYELVSCSKLRDEWRREQEDLSIGKLCHTKRSEDRKFYSWERYGRSERCSQAACQEVLGDLVQQELCWREFQQEKQFSQGNHQDKKWNRFEIHYLCELSAKKEREEIKAAINSTSSLTGTHLSRCDLRGKIDTNRALAILRDSPLGPHLPNLTHLTQPMIQAMENKQKYCALNEIKTAPFKTMKALFKNYKRASQYCLNICPAYISDLRKFAKTEALKIKEEIGELIQRKGAYLKELTAKTRHSMATHSPDASVLKAALKQAEKNYSSLLKSLDNKGDIIEEELEEMKKDYNSSLCPEKLSPTNKLFGIFLYWTDSTINISSSLFESGYNKSFSLK